jgi:hypothetical protein
MHLESHTHSKFSIYSLTTKKNRSIFYEIWRNIIEMENLKFKGTEIKSWWWQAHINGYACVTA